MRRASPAGPILIVAFAVLSTVVGSIVTAVDPGRFDASLFMYMGERLLEGAVLYVDSWDNKPPGIYLLVAAVFWWFPRSVVALAVVQAIFTAGCIATVYAIVRRLSSLWPAAALSALAAAIACNLGVYVERGVLTEIYLLWPATLSMWCFVRGWALGRVRWMLLAGVSAGLASLFKPPGLAPFLAQTVFLVLAVGAPVGPVPRTVATFAMANAAGVALVWLPVVAYFSRVGALLPLLDATVLYNVRYGASAYGSYTRDGLLGLAGVVIDLIRVLTPLASLLACAAIVAVSLALSAHRAGPAPSLRQAGADDAEEAPRPPSVAPPAAARLMLLWLLFDLSGALAGGRHYPHYFLTLTPSLSVLAGLAYQALMEPHARLVPIERRAAGQRLWPIALFVLILGPLLPSQAHDVVAARALLVHGPPAHEDRLVVDLLNLRRGADDLLFSWSYRPAIFFHTGMRSPGRVLDAHYVGDSPAAQAAFGQEILADLRRRRPTFLVDGTPDQDALSRTDPVYREFLTLAREEYVLVHVTPRDRLRLYERRQRQKA